ncbi:MAG TPA: DUF2892 domain-containing protein [Ectothiorhodospiraceae bacterium]|nr:DUF2892 domain-containing protein [Ectothiorhodospiraceae bacterium]
MNVNSLLNIFAGTVIMVSLGMAHISGQIDLGQMSWLWLTLFVGANLFQMGFTGFCPAKIFFKMLGAKESGTCCS